MPDVAPNISDTVSRIKENLRAMEHPANMVGAAAGRMIRNIFSKPVISIVAAFSR